jgi:hypothetical protein
MEEEEARPGARSRQSGHSNAPIGVLLQSLCRPDKRAASNSSIVLCSLPIRKNQNPRIFAGADLPKAAAAPQVPCRGDAHENLPGK